MMQPGGPLAHKCKTLIEPSRLIMLSAQRFIQTFLGERFIALHFQRHGFLKFWYGFPYLKLWYILKYRSVASEVKFELIVCSPKIFT